MNETDRDEVQSEWVSVELSDGSDESSQICVSLRQLQKRRGCSNLLLTDVLETMRPYLRCLGPRRYTDADKRMQAEAGVVCYELHGCAECNTYVYPPTTTIVRCPKCNASRYKSAQNKKANEMIYYFPVTARLKALMRTKKFNGRFRSFSFFVSYINLFACMQITSITSCSASRIPTT